MTDEASSENNEPKFQKQCHIWNHIYNFIVYTNIFFTKLNIIWRIFKTKDKRSGAFWAAMKEVLKKPYHIYLNPQFKNIPLAAELRSLKCFNLVRQTTPVIFIGTKLHQLC